MPPGRPVPILGQQQQMQQKQLEQQVHGMMGQMALGIYTHLATSHIATRDETHQEADKDQLRKHAKEAQVAARCYFEGIGVIQTEEEKGNE
jgi:hypothetical protein